MLTMKKLIRMFGIGLLLLCAICGTTSCNRSGYEPDPIVVDTGNAPLDVSGKTMKIFNTKGEHVWTIVFTSNSSAQVSRLFSHDEPVPTNAQYQKTGSDSATLHLSGEQMSGKDFSLIFISPNQGTANTKGMTFTLF